MEDGSNLPIKHWAADDMPREKLLNRGKGALTDAELIAILLRSGTRKKSAVQLARELLQHAGNNLAQLARLSTHDLMKFNGIGEAKALSIIAALEVGNRRRMADMGEKPIIKSSHDAFDYIQPLLADLNYEQFWVIMLNRANQIMDARPVSDGGATGTVADPKRIFKMALEYNAVNLILCHNHPSGSIQPSDSDKSLTDKLVTSGRMLDMPVLDHLIVGDNAYFSFADEGLI